LRIIYPSGLLGVGVYCIARFIYVGHGRQCYLPLIRFLLSIFTKAYIKKDGTDEQLPAVGKMTNRNFGIVASARHAYITAGFNN